jgi:beta-aspartyl-peptidase (threonine type)
MPLQAAANEVIHKQLTAFRGDGGVIALSRAGELVWTFNTPGMYRARASEGGIPQISIYKDEP